MTDELKQIIMSEHDRLIRALPTVDPTRNAQTYQTMLSSIHELKWMALPESGPSLSTYECMRPEPVPVEPVPVEPIPEEPTSPVPTVVEADPAPVEPDDAIPVYTKEEVRAALAKSRKKGVNVTELLNEFGADNFTGLPAAKYPDLMARLGEI